MGGPGPRGEAGRVQHRTPEEARAIACEWTPCAVRAVSARSESKNENLRIRIAKSRHRLRPIFLVFVGAPLFSADLLAILDKPRAQRACGDLVVEDSEPVGRH